MSIHRWERVVLEKEVVRVRVKGVDKYLLVLIAVVRTRLSAGTCSLTLSGHCTSRSNPE